jgi:hypothetical protein
MELMNVKDLTLAHVKSHLQASSSLMESSLSIIFYLHAFMNMHASYHTETYFYILLASDHSKTRRMYSNF